MRVALGANVPGLPRNVDVVQYLGGDLMHAMRLHKRFGGKAASYKFAKRSYRDRFARIYAVDDANVRQLRDWGVDADRIQIVGNLAIDGAAIEAELTVESGAPEDGVLIMPGSRVHEVENLIPLFFTAALSMRRERPSMPIAFAISPFTPLAQVRSAIEHGGDARVWAKRGRLVEGDGGAFLATPDGAMRFPVLRNGLAAARRARLVLTLPGTKTIEAASLGIPVISITPLNAPEKITVNGLLTYVDRIPLVGVPIKRAAVVAVSKRFQYHTQPNIDAGEMLVREYHGTLTPGRVARLTLQGYDDEHWLQSSGARLRDLYRGHVGAAARMAESLLAVGG